MSVVEAISDGVADADHFVDTAVGALGVAMSTLVQGQGAVAEVLWMGGPSRSSASEHPWRLRTRAGRREEPSRLVAAVERYGWLPTRAALSEEAASRRSKRPSETGNLLAFEHVFD